MLNWSARTQPRGRAGADNPSGRGVHISAIVERSPANDERLAGIFRDMRVSLGLEREQLAARLGTTPQMIALLEAGRIRSLPSWAETVRIVTALGRLVRMDVRPALDRMRQQVRIFDPAAMPAHAGAEYKAPGTARPVTSPAPTTDPGSLPRPPEDRAAATGDDRRRRRLRTARVVFGLSMPAALAVLVAWAVQTQPRGLRAAVAAMPEPIAQPLQSGLEHLTLQLAPRRDGLRWIEVSDPRTRKADKLQPAPR